MARDLSVGFDTRSGPDFEDCGGFSWRVRFLVTDAAGPKLAPKTGLPESWVIQHVVFKETVSRCDGTPYPAEEPDYWEAFRIGSNGWPIDGYNFDFGGNVGPQYIEAGEDDNVSEDNQPFTCGKRTIDLRAYWLATLPPGCMRRSDVTYIKWASGLPASSAPPPGLDPDAWTLRRYVELQWNCCYPGNERSECPTAPGTATGRATAMNKHATYEETWRSDKVHRKVVDGVEVP